MYKVNNILNDLLEIVFKLAKNNTRYPLNKTNLIQTFHISKNAASKSQPIIYNDLYKSVDKHNIVSFQDARSCKTIELVTTNTSARLCKTISPGPAL